MKAVAELRSLLAEQLFYWAVKVSPPDSDCRNRLCEAFMGYSSWLSRWLRKR